MNKAILILLIVSLCISCTETPDEKFDQPVISDLQINQKVTSPGATIQITFTVNAAAGLSKLTVNGDDVPGINTGDTFQMIFLDFVVPSNSTLGQFQIELVVTDTKNQQGLSSIVVLVTDQVVESDTEVVMADSTTIVVNSIYPITSTKEEWNNGIIKMGNVDFTLSSGTILLGDYNGGFIRRIESVTIDGSNVILETSPATMTDAFEYLSYSYSSTDNPAGRAKSLISESYDNVPILVEGGISVLLSGDLSLDGNISGKIDIWQSTAVSAVFDANDLVLTSNLEAIIKVEEDIQLTDSEYELFTVNKVIGQPWPPVWINIELKVKAQIKTKISSAVEAVVKTSQKYALDFHLESKENSWEPRSSYSFEEIENDLSKDFDGVVNIDNELVIIPELNVKFYSVAGPYIKPELFANLDMGVDVETKNWDVFLDIGYRGSYGFDVSALGLGFSALKSEIDPGSFRLWEAPYEITTNLPLDTCLIGGLPLADSVRIFVSDNLGNPLVGVPVFSKIEGKGELAQEAGFTNEDGYVANFLDVDYDDGEDIYPYADPSHIISFELRNRNDEMIKISQNSFQIVDLIFTARNLSRRWIEYNTSYYYGRIKYLSQGENGCTNGLSSTYYIKWFSDVDGELITTEDIDDGIIYVGGYALTRALSPGPHIITGKVFSTDNNEFVYEDTLNVDILLPEYYWAYESNGAQASTFVLFKNKSPNTITLLNDPKYEGVLEHQHDCCYSTFNSSIQGVLSLNEVTNYYNTLWSDYLIVGTHQISGSIYNKITDKLVLEIDPITVEVLPDPNN